MDKLIEEIMNIYQGMESLTAEMPAEGENVDDA